jgi:hypothetical protein
MSESNINIIPKKYIHKNKLWKNWFYL